MLSTQPAPSPAAFLPTCGQGSADMAPSRGILEDRTFSVQPSSARATMRAQMPVNPQAHMPGFKRGETITGRRHTRQNAALPSVLRKIVEAVRGSETESVEIPAQGKPYRRHCKAIIERRQTMSMKDIDPAAASTLEKQGDPAHPPRPRLFTPNPGKPR